MVGRIKRITLKVSSFYKVFFFSGVYTLSPKGSLPIKYKWQLFGLAAKNIADDAEPICDAEY